jgi:hypothetical protein
MKQPNRVVKSIERAFYAFAERRVHHVGFSELKDWINGNTKDGISSPRLASFLRKNEQFKHISRIRKVGTNITETYWTLGRELDAPEEKGWVQVIKEVDTGI